MYLGPHVWIFSLGPWAARPSSFLLQKRAAIYCVILALMPANLWQEEKGSEIVQSIFAAPPHFGELDLHGIYPYIPRWL